jgi:transcriptional antiterminator NusG|nr:MAG: transcription termination/antitermination protein NusG [Gammaproteobacteria bacterium]|tara:strand:- start:1370 stop:1957 length:588 start_codon:yes stop_codon:yes gene_type:complete
MGLGFSFFLWIKFIIGVEMSKSWYVLNSYSGYENKAKEQLLERITLNGMEDFFGKIEVPSEEITEMKGGKEKTIQKKFFPGYILVEMEMNDDTWHLVKETPRVLGFIGGTKTNPRPISENEANRILNQIESGVETTSQQNIYEAGEMIRVIDGPFNDFSGVIEEVDSEKGKVKVAVMIFGRSTPVELDFNQIERA